MTLDEAIRHCEEVAEEKDKSVELYRAVKATEGLIAKCENCAKEHRQLAEWLKELKVYKEQQSCEDCISRQAVLDDISSNWDWETVDGITATTVLKQVMTDITNTPSVTLARPKGEWISETFTTSINPVPKCPFCNKRASKFSNFCPNCGAKMVEPQEIHCNCTDEEIAKSFIEDVEAVKDLLP